MSDLNKQEIKVSVIGLGYVGLPVAVFMSEKFPTVGFDINQKRISELKNNKDSTHEVSSQDLKKAKITFTDDISGLESCNFHIVAVPTPVTDAKVPDLSPLESATRTTAKVLKKGDTVVFESTVYPGATEEVCVPILMEVSGLAREDFSVGYSPERINPGDKEHSFTKITKVVSGDTPESLEKIAFVYGEVVEAGVFKADSIRVAEMAKVIENTQRDINIALMNELTVICDKLDINIYSVLNAAKTKWNFLPFTPGLVGGHCIGVDPYYLTYKATQIGHHPEVILSGRRINDSMPQYVSQKIIKTLINNALPVKGETINILGLTFKENCPDLRNTRVTEIIKELKDYGMNVNVCDPQASADEALEEYGIELTDFAQLPKAAMTIVAVKHDQFLKLAPEDIESDLIFDIKGIFGKSSSKTIVTL